MNRQFRLGAIVLVTAVLSSSAFAGADSLSEVYTASLMDRCVKNGGLDPAAVQDLTDAAFLKALTDCANRNAVAQPSPAPVYTPAPAYAPVPAYEPAERSYVPSPSYSSAPRYVPRQEAADDGSGGGSVGGGSGGGGVNISDILSSNIFGRRPGNAGQAPSDPGPVGPVGQVPTGPGPGPAGPGPAGPGPAAPVKPTDARLASIDAAIQKGIQSGAITPQEAASLGSQLQVAKGINANLGDTGAALLVKQRALDKLAADTNAALHNDQGIPSPEINTLRAKMAGKPGNAAPGAQAIDPKTGKPVAGTPQTLQQKLADRMAPKLDPKTGKPVAGTPQTLQQKLADRMATKVDPKTGKPNADQQASLRRQLQERMKANAGNVAKFDPKAGLREVAKRQQTASIKPSGNQTLQHNGSNGVFTKPAHVSTTRVHRPEVPRHAAATPRTVTRTPRAIVQKVAPRFTAKPASSFPSRVVRSGGGSPAKHARTSSLRR